MLIAEARLTLKKVYGYSDFRKGQEDIIAGLLEGRDTLAILPTGGGKSICYQIPALLLPGTTLVISPLISLMKDQVDALQLLGVSAAYLNSSLSASEYRDVLRRAMQGQYKLLYVAPERLDAPMFQSLSEQLQIPLIAIDEAHCVSQWGHDFRPSYRQLAGWIGRMPTRPLTAAFTATATQEVADDISDMLKLREPNVLVTGFARPNLSLSVITGADKRSFLLSFLANHKEQSGIIYAATRKEVEQLHELLLQQGIPAGKYHGGLSDTERSEAQELFRFDHIQIMVATNAFGMGIDKPNVRFVLHWQLPSDIESYYQEAGRAGRDGEESECVLLFDPADMQVQRFLIEQGTGDTQRKSIQLSKLHQMMSYSRTQRCLQQFIVDYFGETDVSACGKCSSCLDTSELVNRTEEAKMALSCVGRMKGRFGVLMVAKVLKGSRDKKLLNFGLDRLSTYGLMRNLPEKEIADWLYWLVSENYLKLSDGQYPTVSLTSAALPVLEGREAIMQRMRSAFRAKDAGRAGGANPLFDALKQWRKDRAALEGIPPFMLFYDSTLREIAEMQPQSQDELLNVKGIGMAKAGKYGEELIELIAAHGGQTAVQPSAQQTTARPGAIAGSHNAADEQPSYLVTCEMFQAGMEPAEIAVERGLTKVTVEGHIIRGCEEGLSLDWSRIIPAQYESMIVEAVQAIGSGKLRPIKEALPEEVSYFAIHGVICKYSLKR